MITSLYWVYLLFAWFSSLRTSLLLLAVMTQKTNQQWLHRKWFYLLCCLSGYSCNPGRCVPPVLSQQTEKKKDEYTVSGIKWNASFKLRNKWNVESLNSLNGIQSSNLCCWVACRGTVVVLFFFFARACWVQQIGVNWLEFTLEEPQGYTVISTQREKPGNLSNIILKCCQGSIRHLAFSSEDFPQYSRLLIIYVISI